MDIIVKCEYCGEDCSSPYIFSERDDKGIMIWHEGHKRCMMALSNKLKSKNKENIKDE